MTRLLLMLPLLLLITACATGTRTSSPLERFDKLGSQLDDVTESTRQVSVDLGALAGSMSAAQQGGVRTRAETLRRHGDRLYARALVSAGQIHLLLNSSKNPIQRRYFEALFSALRYDCREGIGLSTLARIAWADPLALQPQNSIRIQTLSRDLQWYAWRSVLATARAASWRRAHMRSFQYHPSPPPAQAAASPVL